MVVIKANQIYNMDCFDGMALMNKNSVQCVLTSPPYNTINKNLQKRTDRGYDVYKDNIDNNEYWGMIVKCFSEYDRILCKDGVVIYNLSYGNQNNECMIRTVYNILEYTNFTMADIMVWKNQIAFQIQFRKTNYQGYANSCLSFAEKVSI